jgi:AbrB family looped-hinge helix DNA binding protein
MAQEQCDGRAFRWWRISPEVAVIVNGISVKISDGGRVVIPAQLRRALGLEVGDEVIIRVADGELRILTRKEAVKRAQSIVAGKVNKGRSLVDELAKERRAEAANE